MEKKGARLHPIGGILSIPGRPKREFRLECSREASFGMALFGSGLNRYRIMPGRWPESGFCPGISRQKSLTP